MAGIDDTNIVGANLETFEGGLKTKYLPSIRVQFNSASLTYNRLRRNKFPVSGVFVEVSLNTRRTEGYGFTRTGFQLPDAHHQTHEKMRFRWQNLYGRIKVDGRAIQASRSDAGAFANLLDTEIRGMVRDMNNDLNRIIYGDGSGRLGLVSSVASAASGTVQVQEVFDGPDQAKTLRWIRPGMIVAFVDVSASSLANTQPSFATLDAAGRKWGYVSAVNRAAKTITITAVPQGTGAGAPIDLLTGVPSVAVGDAIVRIMTREDNALASDALAYSWSNFRGHRAVNTIADEHEIMGLAGIISDEDVAASYETGAVSATPLQGISAASNPDWQSYVQGGGGAAIPLNILDMQTCIDEMEQTGEAEPSAMFTSYGVNRAYLHLCHTQHRFVNTMKLDTGHNVLTFNGMPFIVDKDALTGEIFFVDESTLGFGELEDISWLSKEGGGILQKLDNYDVYQASLVLSTEMATDRRNANARLRSIQEA